VGKAKPELLREIDKVKKELVAIERSVEKSSIGQTRNRMLALQATLAKLEREVSRGV
jgi:hypothetical protein